MLECIILEKWRCSLSRIIQIWTEAKFSQVNHVIWLSVFSLKLFSLVSFGNSVFKPCDYTVIHRQPCLSSKIFKLYLIQVLKQ